MAFAENLKHLMDVEGYSNYKLAKELGCHQTTVQNWLDGSIPQKRTQKNIAAVFGVSTYDLMGDSVPTPQKEKSPPAVGELTEMQIEAVELIKNMNDDQLNVILAAAKAMMGE